MTVFCVLLAMVVSYLLGSVNFAIIVTKLFLHQDIRSFGSGNAGMTNVLRTVGKGAAVVVTLGDFSKGLLSALFMRALFCFVLQNPDGSLPFEYVAAICALLGHLFPVFYKFKGGKGILVSAGALLAISPYALLCSVIAFAIGTFSTKIVSVGSIASAMMFPIATFVIRTIEHSDTRWWETLLAILIGGAIIFMHRANIGRLLRGEENRFGKKK